MIEYVLILMMHVGPMGSGNSNALNSVSGFIDYKECPTAGEAARNLAINTVKEIKFVCVKQTKKG